MTLTHALKDYIFEQVPGNIGWKDKDFCFLGCNNHLAAKLRLNDPNDIIGLSDKALIDNSEESFHFHRKNDLLALEGCTIKMVHKSFFPHDETMHFLIKKPLMNAHQIDGIIFHCDMLNTPNIFLNLQKKESKYSSVDQVPNHYYIDSTINTYNLSARELECLFCLLRSFTAKKIAKVLGLSTRTIEFYIDNIKNKLGCRTKTDLIIEAIRHGYMHFIPARFLASDITTMME